VAHGVAVSFSTVVDDVVDGVINGEAVGLEARAETLWNQCAEALRLQVSDATWKTWFEQARVLTFDTENLVIAVPSSLAKERIESRYLDLVRGTAASVAGRRVEVRLEVVTSPDAGEPRQDTLPLGDASLPAMATGASALDAGPKVTAQVRARDDYDDDMPLNPRYSFEDFVTGTSNRFAHAAALSVAEMPAKSYNPLYIYGGVGLGKTHLLHAIGNYVRTNYPEKRVRYVSTETFTNEFIDAIRNNTTTAFKRRYRQCDVLLVDDIQFLENKEGTQEEFFHTFNSLHGASRQIVLTSDRPPKSIATLEDRLRTRFEWGLITDVQPPDLETRIAILRRKADGDGATVPAEVMEFIATHVTDNIRELEGALIRITAYSSLNREPLTITLAESVLSSIVNNDQPRLITPKIILDATAKTFGFTVDELCGKSRRRPLVTARQIGMYVFREMTDSSYPAIGREFGGRDHTTVIHAVEKITTQMREKRVILEQVTELINLIKSGG
jgi:chromosomal replication initiator protein